MSKWTQGVDEYAKELLETFNENYPDVPVTEQRLLDGVANWHEYSWGGSSLIYNDAIAERLATPSEIKRRIRRNGTLDSYANGTEQWLDVQARALYQASNKILNEGTIQSWNTLNLKKS